MSGLIFFIAIFLAVPVGAEAFFSRTGCDLGAITVTAEKQEENIQDVSSSITVMDALDIEDKKIESVAEIIDYVPNMMTFNDGMATVNKVTTRGISVPSMIRYATSTGMYIDGVPTLGNFGFEEGLIDIVIKSRDSFRRPVEMRIHGTTYLPKLPRNITFRRM